MVANEGIEALGKCSCTLLAFNNLHVLLYPKAECKSFAIVHAGSTT